jgi:hypothetical protein
MVFTISVISWWWWLVLLVAEIFDLPEVTDKLSHNVVWSTPHLSGIRTHNFSGGRH